MKTAQQETARAARMYGLFERTAAAKGSGAQNSGKWKRIGLKWGLPFTVARRVYQNALINAALDGNIPERRLRVVTAQETKPQGGGN